jgi:hypothetical protein
MLHIDEDCECEIGYDDYDGDIYNGCEKEIDLNDCCGYNCINCSRLSGCDSIGCDLIGGSYQCRFYCALSFLDCDGDWENGCEVDTYYNNDNCGGCGYKCPEGTRCDSGSCK